MAILIRCSECRKLLRVADSAAGKKAKCPGCRAIMIVPMDGARETKFDQCSPPVSVANSAREDCGYELVPDVISPAAATMAACNRCPNCEKALPLDAVLCVECGFDLRTQRRLPSVVGQEASGQAPTQGEESNGEELSASGWTTVRQGLVLNYWAARLAFGFSVLETGVACLSLGFANMADVRGAPDEAIAIMVFSGMLLVFLGAWLVTAGEALLGEDSADRNIKASIVSPLAGGHFFIAWASISLAIAITAIVLVGAFAAALIGSFMCCFVPSQSHLRGAAVATALCNVVFVCVLTALCTSQQVPIGPGVVLFLVALCLACHILFVNFVRDVAARLDEDGLKESVTRYMVYYVTIVVIAVGVGFVLASSAKSTDWIGWSGIFLLMSIGGALCSALWSMPYSSDWIEHVVTPRVTALLARARCGDFILRNDLEKYLVLCALAGMGFLSTGILIVLFGGKSLSFQGFVVLVSIGMFAEAMILWVWYLMLLRAAFESISYEQERIQLVNSVSQR